MNNILSALNKTISFLTPVATKLWGSAVAVTDAVCDSVKKSNKKAKRHIKLIKLKNMLEIISSITLLIATVIALFCALGEYLRKRDN